MACLHFFNMSGALGLLLVLVVAHCVVLASSRLIPLQLPTNATLSDSAVSIVK